MDNRKKLMALALQAIHMITESTASIVNECSDRVVADEVEDMRKIIKLLEG